MDVSVLAIDIAKSVFQLHGVSATNKVLFRRKVRRADFLRVVSEMPRTKVVLEAGWSAHYWGRELSQLGHDVKLIAPQHVKPFVQTNKSDEADAAAICEAARRPGMKFVSVKSLEQQEIQTLHRVRSRYVRQRTALCNEVRGILSEYGIVVRCGISNVRKALSEIVNVENQFCASTRRLFSELSQELVFLSERVKRYDKQLEQIASHHPISAKLMDVPGIGPITATAALCSVGDAHQFKNGRSFSANIGLVPRHAGTGGKNKNGSISKRGDVYFRQLLVHGARAVIRTAGKKDDKGSRWIKQLVQRCGFNKATVAVANKTARILWVLMTSDKSYDPALAYGK